MSRETLFSSKMKIISVNDNVSVENSLSNNNLPSETTGSLEERRDQRKIDEGYQIGWKECETKMKNEIAVLQENIDAINNKIPESINIYLEKLEEQLQEEICEIGFSLAEVIVNKEVENKSIIADTIKNITADIVNTKGLKLYLNPTIVSQIENGESDINAKGIEILSDTSLGMNDAILETSQGIIDASVATRLKTLKESLNEALTK